MSANTLSPELRIALENLKEHYQAVADLHEVDTHTSASEVVYLVDRLLFELKSIERQAI